MGGAAGRTLINTIPSRPTHGTINYCDVINIAIIVKEHGLLGNWTGRRS
jgi:hypothetical protein